MHTELIERFLDYLIEPNECIDTFGRTYLDDLEYVVVENHGFDFDVQKFPDKNAQEWFERIRSGCGFKNLEEMIVYVREHTRELDLTNVRPRTTFHGETLFESEPSFQDLKKEIGSIARSNEFQRMWSIRSGRELPENDTDADYYELFMGYDRMNPWTYLVRREIARGRLSPNDVVICLGNRWVGEILYFRKNLGLPNTMGVDLVSSNPALVVAADMHSLPFEDGSIGMIFTRGAINKSYDVRLLAKEMLRVLKKDGFLIVETPGPYKYGVTRLGRTDVKSANNLLRLFAGKIGRIIYTDEMKPYRYQYDVTRLVRVFIQLDKDGGHGNPAVESFPYLRLKMYAAWRQYLLRLRRKLRRLGLLRSNTA